MRIADIRAVLLSHPYPDGEKLEWVGGRIDSWDAALVEVKTDDGVTGIGEVAQGIMAAVAVPGIVDALRPYVVGYNFRGSRSVGDDLRSRTVFWSRGGIVSGTIGAIEAATLDAAAKERGLPLYVYLGGTSREKIELYASGGLGSTVEAVSEWIARQQDAGLRTVKFRALRTPDMTVELMNEVVPGLGDTQFVLDAVQGCASSPWSIENAIRVGRVAGELGARWYEEPRRAEDIRGYAAVRRAVDVPISGIESFSRRDEFEFLIDCEGVDIAQPDAAMLGGPVEFLRVAELVADRDLDCIPHIWGTAVTLMMNLHLAFTAGTISLVEFCTLPNPLREALLVEPLRVVDGYVLRPSAPGLGVCLPDAIEDEYRFTPGRGHLIY